MKAMPSQFAWSSRPMRVVGAAVAVLGAAALLLVGSTGAQAATTTANEAIALDVSVVPAKSGPAPFTVKFRVNVVDPEAAEGGGIRGAPEPGKFMWTFSDGTKSTQQNPVKTFFDPNKTYTATVNYVDPDGGRARATEVIETYQQRMAVTIRRVRPAPNVGLIAPAEVTYQVQFNPGLASGPWDVELYVFGPSSEFSALPVQRDEEVTLTLPKAGTYTIVATVAMKKAGGGSYAVRGSARRQDIVYPPPQVHKTPGPGSPSPSPSPNP